MLLIYPPPPPVQYCQVYFLSSPYYEDLNLALDISMVEKDDYESSREYNYLIKYNILNLEY